MLFFDIFCDLIVNETSSNTERKLVLICVAVVSDIKPEPLKFDVYMPVFGEQ